MGGLYHAASKQLHGHEEVVIDARTWTPNEVLSLGVLFSYHKIPFKYHNNDKLDNFPYKIKSE